MVEGPRTPYPASGWMTSPRRNTLCCTPAPTCCVHAPPPPPPPPRVFVTRTAGRLQSRPSHISKARSLISGTVNSPLVPSETFGKLVADFIQPQVLRRAFSFGLLGIKIDQQPSAILLFSFFCQECPIIKTSEVVKHPTPIKLLRLQHRSPPLLLRPSPQLPPLRPSRTRSHHVAGTQIPTTPTRHQP
jgi:hypothetical protein